MSSIAVFLVLGGATALAAGGLAKNSVGSKQLKKNAVTAAKIKNNAITTAKIGKEAVTGDKIKESSLGAVPTATNATNAVNATNATNAVNATNFSRYFNLGLKKASVGQTNVSLGNVGPFTFVGDCEAKGGGVVEASIFLLTSVENSEMESYGEQYDWNMKTTDRAEIGYDSTSETEPYGFFYSYWDGWSAATPDGSIFLQGEAHPMVKTLGADCAFLVTGFNETP
jgi:hypothetical protein